MDPVWRHPTPQVQWSDCRRSLRRLLLPLQDVIYGSVVDAESDTKLGTSFKKVVRRLQLNFAIFFKTTCRLGVCPLVLTAYTTCTVDAAAGAA